MTTGVRRRVGAEWTEFEHDRTDALHAMEAPTRVPRFSAPGCCDGSRRPPAERIVTRLVPPPHMIASPSRAEVSGSSQPRRAEETASIVLARQLQAVEDQSWSRKLEEQAARTRANFVQNATLASNAQTQTTPQTTPRHERAASSSTSASSLTPQVRSVDERPEAPEVPKVSIGCGGGSTEGRRSSSMSTVASAFRSLFKSVREHGLNRGGDGSRSSNSASRQDEADSGWAGDGRATPSTSAPSWQDSQPGANSSQRSFVTADRRTAVIGSRPAIASSSRLQSSLGRQEAIDQQTIISRFTPPPAGATGALVDCTICMQAFCEGELVRTLPCLHRYHAHCVDRWLAASDACPICKHGVAFGNQNV